MEAQNKDISNTNISDTVNQLVAQLQAPAGRKDEKEFSLKREELEDFIIQQSGQLVKGSVEFIEELKEMLVSAPEAKDVEALSKYVAATAAAIESLNKVYTANKTEALKIKLKNMDIESKKQLQSADIGSRLVMNREEILKRLIDDAKLIEAEVTTVSPSLTSRS
jgi:hypothetical protein